MITARLVLAVLVSAAPLVSQSDDAPTATAEIPRHTVEIDERVSLSVRDMGAGSPVLLLTGGPGFSGDTTLGLFKHVAASHRAVLPDQRGTGLSKIEPFDTSLFTMDDVVGDLEAIRKSLEIETWTVAGHSWGGILGMAYASRHPERVERLLLVGPGGLTSAFFRTYQSNLTRRMDAESRAQQRTLRPAGNSMKDIADMIRRSNRLMAGAMVAVPEAADRLRDDFMSPANFEPRVGIALQPVLTMLDLRESVAAYEGPVRVLQGSEDPIGRGAVDAIVEAFPNASLQILEGAGHWPEIETPEAFFSAVDAFLNDDSASRSASSTDEG